MVCHQKINSPCADNYVHVSHIYHTTRFEGGIVSEIIHSCVQYGWVYESAAQI